MSESNNSQQHVRDLLRLMRDDIVEDLAAALERLKTADKHQLLVRTEPTIKTLESLHKTFVAVFNVLDKITSPCEHLR